mmetsp:Transcript_31556/g.80357  ORF Transcript_31556/g.80357 Transcript_31556/m.80357 type:complete len:763 (-) Transcript_31556:8026-10314(-)
MHAQLLVSIKALLPNFTRKGYVRSGEESPLRVPGRPNKAWRAKVTTRRLTKLLHNDCTILYAVRYHPGKGTSMPWLPSRMYWGPLATGISHSHQDVFTPVNVMQRAKVTYFEGCGNMRYPKALKGYGYGASILGLNRREAGLRFYTKSSIFSDPSSASCDIISKHRELNKDPNFVNRRLINIIGDEQTLVFAYELVKSNPGQLTKGSTSTALDGISPQWIKHTSALIKAGKFKFTPGKKVCIQKPGCEEKRSLTISSSRDKVVQKAIQLVLEPIYEGIFLENSHGFRPSRGCHTALKTVKKWFHGVTWVIESDIAGCFPSVDHNVLLNIIRERVKCDKTVALIRNLLEAGYIDLKVFCESKMGVPQGSSLSPLLCNIYLHKLDVFMAEVRQGFVYTGKTSRRTNPDYKALQRHLQKTSDPAERSELIQKLRKIPSKDPFDSDFRRLFYIRYADDFVIGITGSRKEAVEVLDQVKGFLSEELKMSLKESKTHIVHFKKQAISFLGVTMYGISRTEKPIRTVKHPGWRTSIKVRVTPRVGLHAPIKTLLDKLCKNKFIKSNKLGIYKPTALRRMVNFDHADILGYYNGVARGIMNFFSFVDNYTRIGAIVKYHLLHSCALTLALKYKLRFKAKAFKRFGKKLKCPESSKEFYIPKDFKRTNTFRINPPNEDSIIARRWNNKLTKSNLFKACVICGATPAEMHHVRKVRDLKNKFKSKKLDFFHMQMAGINRKQVPLCMAHHKALHQSKLTEAEKMAFKEGIKNL